MILIVATICLGSTGSKAGSVAIVIASSIRLSRSIRAASRAHHARRLGEQVDPAGERLVDPADAAPGRDLGDQARGLVLVHVARARAGRRSPSATPAARERARDRPADSRRPFLKTSFPARTECARIAPSASAERQIAEPHAAGSWRSTRVISAITESAISAGLTAPIASPAGPWMRAERRRVVAERAPGARAAPRGSACCRARRCRRPPSAAPGRAPDRRASGRGSASRPPCAHRASAPPAPRRASRCARRRRESARRSRTRGAGSTTVTS